MDGPKVPPAQDGILGHVGLRLMTLRDIEFLTQIFLEFLAT